MPDTVSTDTLPDSTLLAAPLDGAAPCGENMEYAPLFLAMAEAASGKPEVQYGSTITPATPPDWQAVRGIALQLMEGTRDLRVAVLLARALLHLDGAPGLASGLALVAGLLTQCWDGVHPQLEPDDGMDPTLRVNVLATLCVDDGLPRDLRAMPLAQVRALGSVSLRDLDLATVVAESGNAADAPPGQPILSPAVIDAVFGAADQAALAATTAALDAALTDAVRIEQLLTERVGVGSALDMAPLAALLRRAGDAVRAHLRADAPAPGEIAAQPAAAGARAPRDGAIASRADVIRTLDAVCAWYAAHEPASPVPLLLARACKLVDKSFTELLQDLAPDGLSQLAQVSGIRNDS